jgi:hypothetical protein
MATIATYTLQPQTDGPDQWADDEIDVRFTKRGYGGWLIKRADNGRTLGWVTRVDGRMWDAHVSASAFRGETIDDEGDVLDSVPGYLFNGEGLSSRSIAVCATREDAAYEVVTWLRRKQAPALGYGRHYAVQAYRCAL